MRSNNEEILCREVKLLTAERDQLRALYSEAREGLNELGTALESCRIELAEARAEVARLRGDNQAWIATAVESQSRAEAAERERRKDRTA